MARTSALKKRALGLKKKGKFGEAARLLNRVCAQDPADRGAWLELGRAQLKLGKPAEALSAFRGAMRIGSDDEQPLLGMAEAYCLAGQYGESQKCCELAIRTHPDSWEAYFLLGDAYRQQSAFDASEQCYQKVVDYRPDHVLANYYLANMLKTQGRVDEANEYYGRAIRADPDFVEAYWNKLRILPVIYDDESQIDVSRKDYAQGLEELKQNLDFSSRESRRQALRGLNTSTNFYLQYQGLDDLVLQCKYGEIVQAVMAANFPQWAGSLEKRLLKEGERIRVGYCSAYLRDHNGANWLAGWLRHRNAGEFEIFCYHMGGKADGKTEELRQLSDHFRHIPGDLNGVCERIASDNLDILVYPELGMDTQSLMMAGLRLAPVQYVGWGHPVTSGLTTMDYWLSSDLMEPEDGQKHYLEKLVRLPNMANCYSSAQRDRIAENPPKKSRKDFGLPEDSVLYFCSQSLFKYLPQYDYLWPEIAKRVPESKFVFLSISSVHVVKRFMTRVDKLFAGYNLRAADHCIMLNRQSAEDYLNLNLLADVFLDNPPWSGNNTGLAAVDCDLPIVTYPTATMRGRHSYAILQMLGVTETIANSGQEYIDIAARLGLNPQFRASIKAKINALCSRIYEDIECVRYLEQFYKTSVT